jgi:exonuclease VII small subunit
VLPQKTSQNADDVESFAKRIQALIEILEQVTKGDLPLSKPMLDRIDHLSK